MGKKGQFKHRRGMRNWTGGTRVFTAGLTVSIYRTAYYYSTVSYCSSVRVANARSLWSAPNLTQPSVHSDPPECPIATSVHRSTASLPDLHGPVGQVGVHAGAIRAHDLFVPTRPGQQQPP